MVSVTAGSGAGEEALGWDLCLQVVFFSSVFAYLCKATCLFILVVQVEDIYLVPLVGLMLEKLFFLDDCT